MKRPPPHLVLYDGSCGLCHGLVKFLLQRDKGHVLHFAALQSDLAAKVLAGTGFSPESLSTFYLVESYQSSAPHISVRSTAAIRLAPHLGIAIRALGLAASLVPRPLRDVVYGFVAKRRKRWFGEHAACVVPTPELRARFPAGYM
jgi:predicted DCC family thiol-disulfide oxidoreductase YuxK